MEWRSARLQANRYSTPTTILAYILFTDSGRVSTSPDRLQKRTEEPADCLFQDCIRLLYVL